MQPSVPTRSKQPVERQGNLHDDQDDDIPFHAKAAEVSQQGQHGADGLENITEGSLATEDGVRGKARSMRRTTAEQRPILPTGRGRPVRSRGSRFLPPSGGFFMRQPSSSTQVAIIAAGFAGSQIVNRSSRFSRMLTMPLYSSSLYGSMVAPENPYRRISVAFSAVRFRT